MIDKLLILRTCETGGRSRNGFRWPLEVGATVEEPDWDPDPQHACGGGLHGLPWGYGNGYLLDGPVWLIVEVDLLSGCVGSGGGCRFRRGTVLHVGDQRSATDYLAAAGPIVGGHSESGSHGHSESGDRGRSVSGDRGHSVSGDRGHSVSGDWGTSVSGDCGLSVSGRAGLSESGVGGHSESGVGGTIAIWWIDDGGRRQKVVGHVGEDGILPDVAYRVKNGQLMPVRDVK